MAEDKIEYTAGTTKPATVSLSVSFTKLTVAQIADLKNRFGISKSMVIRLAVQELHNRLNDPGATISLVEK